MCAPRWRRRAWRMRSWRAEDSVETGLAPSPAAEGDAASRVSTGKMGSDAGCFGQWDVDSEHGKSNFKHGTAFGPVVASDLSLMVLNNAVSGTESETGAFADRLGGVERIEDALRIAQARAGIGELHDHFVGLAP